MKKIMSVKVALAVVALLIATACTKQKNELTPAGEITLKGSSKATTGASTLGVNDTLMNLTYESGQLNSGVTGITATDATATDAAYLISPGVDTSNYGIAHKVIQGDPTYSSAGNYRSESDAIAYAPAKFVAGNERRYEFSMLLKDWPSWTNEPDLGEVNLFQTKITGPPYVPIMIKTNRNTIRVRYPNTSVGTVVSDFRPYVNQWINYRIDVLWSMNTDGYIKIYTKLPNEQDYILRTQLLNIRTYTGDGLGGQFGYLKWGIYGLPLGATRIAYHDNIRIIKLPLQ